MPRNRFIRPETLRITISDGDWIEVKRYLTFGEQQRLIGSGFRSVRTAGGTEFGLDWESLALEKILIWLVEWSFRDHDDKPVKISREAIAALDPDTAKEVGDAIDAHVEALEEAKKEASGAIMRVVQ